MLKNLRELESDYPAALTQAFECIAGEDGVRMYLVGGTVRDRLLGRICHDLDIAVCGSALFASKRLMALLGGGTMVDLSGPEDQTFRVVWRGEQIDFSSFRSGVKTIEEDLLLRDFTVNAMAVQLLPTGQGEEERALIDPTGGLADLLAGRVKVCPGAFAADPVRMLRGYRLCATLGFFLDQNTRECIGKQAALIDRVAAERISYELQLIFESPRTTLILREMGETGLLRRLLPELYLAEGVEQPEFHHLDVMNHCLLALQMMEEILAEPDRFFPGYGSRIAAYLKDKKVGRCLKWAALLHDIGKPATREIRDDKDGRVTFYRHDEVGRELFQHFAERSKWSKADTELVGSLIEMHMHPFHLCNVQREKKISKRAALKLCRRAEDALTGLFLLAMSDSLASRGEKKPEKMEEELLALFATVARIYEENIAPVWQGPRLLTGRDLIKECNLVPGPLFSEILEELETARVEGTVVDRTTALAWVEEFLQGKTA